MVEGLDLAPKADTTEVAVVRVSRATKVMTDKRDNSFANGTTE